MSLSKNRTGNLPNILLRDFHAVCLDSRVSVVALMDTVLVDDYKSSLGHFITGEACVCHN